MGCEDCPDEVGTIASYTCSPVTDSLHSRALQDCSDQHRSALHCTVTDLH